MFLKSLLKANLVEGEGFCTQIVRSSKVKKLVNENSVFGGSVLNPDAFYSASLCFVLWWVCFCEIEQE